MNMIHLMMMNRNVMDATVRDARYVAVKIMHQVPRNVISVSIRTNAQSM